MTGHKPKAAFFGNRPSRVHRVYRDAQVETLDRLANFYRDIITSQNFAEHIEHLSDVEYVFSTWGMPELTVEQVRQMPGLKAVFYAAGTVKYFAAPFLENGVRVVSAWAANAVPVGEFAAAQIMLAGKAWFAANRRMHRQQSPRDLTVHGNYGNTVSLLGAGMVGREVIRRLPGFNIRVFDPFLSDADANALGVIKVPLDVAFSEANIVSNHLANVPETEGMITGELLRRLPQGGTFINTGRGATVVESELIDVLKARPDLTALLDVTDPEPPVLDSPLYSLENVWLTPHIAGSLGNEVMRMADLVIEEFQHELAGEPLRYEVRREQLATMA